jgi:PA-IL-like protein
MADERESNNFWTTLPGILTGLGALLGAIGGLLTAYHSTFNPSESSTIKEFEIYANSTKGEFYTNEESQSVIISFMATGTWLAIPSNPAPNTVNNSIPDSAKDYISAKGDLNFSSSNDEDVPCPRSALGALVVKNKDSGECLADGDQGTFTLKPGETIQFLMNDVKGLYNDNSGSIQVKLHLDKK